MKKVIRDFIFIFCLIVGSLLTINNTSASTLQMYNQSNIYFVHVNTDGSEYSSHPLPVYYVDGKLAYCVQPGVNITTSNYDLVGWDVTQLSAEQRRYIEMVGYYGYEYPTHTGNIKYYMAAQELIWKAIKSMDVSWSTEKYGNGTPINIENEKNEILSLVTKFDIKPSFNAKTITGTIGDTISINDDNGVLSNFYIVDSGSHNVSIDGNTLNVSLNSTGKEQIRLKFKSYDNDTTLVYYSSGSQTVAHTRLSDPVYSAINVETVAGKVFISKVDKDTGTSIPQGESSLKDAIYDIYDENDIYITSITTDENGQAISSNLLNLGRYYLVERTASEGYQLDTTKYYFDMTKDELYPNIKVYEKVINRDFEFTKVFASDKTGIMTPEQNVEFGVYDSNNKLIIKKKTDEEGKIYFNLPYGRYILRQLTVTKDYEKADDYEFEVKEIGKTINKVISNAEIKAKLKVIKIDSETGNIIKKSNIKFKILDVKTGEYVRQTITYPIAMTTDTFKTDSNGILITPYPLSSGTYKLIEIDQLIDGYLWNQESIEFQIGEDSELITDNEFGILFEVKFKNTAVKGELNITKNGENMQLTENGYVYTEIKLCGVKIGLFANEDIYDSTSNLMYKKGSKIGEYITDEEGNITISNLYLGKYYIQELETVNNHALDSTKYMFELKYKDQYTPIVEYSLIIKNYLPKGTLEFRKTDVSESNPLPNTLIEIYTETDELVFSGRTDEEGKIVLNKLPLGKYYILEKEAPDGYQLNSEKMYFEIKNDGEIIKSIMKDEKIVEVPMTDKNSIITPILLILILFGVGLIIYGTKKRKNL